MKTILVIFLLSLFSNVALAIPLEECEDIAYSSYMNCIKTASTSQCPNPYFNNPQSPYCGYCVMNTFLPVLHSCKPSGQYSGVCYDLLLEEHEVYCKH
ncbi:MAG: hypothetical protein HOO06_08830 [Bdellovibrionaceae bacterium]|nr:hypothetical protein [Pseudobdellovibrionaceae bacterium]